MNSDFIEELADDGATVFKFSHLKWSETPDGRRKKTPVGMPPNWTKFTAADNNERLAGPGAGFAVATNGPYSVVDIDPRNGGDIDTLIASELLPPVQHVVETASGGWHLYVEHLNIPKFSIDDLGVDIQANGGCVFAPPTEGYHLLEEGDWPDGITDYGSPRGRSNILDLGTQNAAPDISDITVAVGAPWNQAPDGDTETRLAAEDTDRVLGKIKASLAAAAALPEGARDANGRGWDDSLANAAFDLARLTVSPWSMLDFATAATWWTKNAPVEMVKACGEKFDNGRLKRAAQFGAYPREILNEMRGLIPDERWWDARLNPAPANTPTPENAGTPPVETPRGLAEELVSAYLENVHREYFTQREKTRARALAEKDDATEILETQVRRLVIQDRARREFKRRTEPEQEPFDFGTVEDIMARPEEPEGRVEGLIGWSTNTMIIAQRKTGKTTFMLNLAKSFITGADLLGTFKVATPLRDDQKVALLNYEVNDKQIAAWVNDIGVPPDRLCVAGLRGRRNPLSHEEDRDRLAQFLRTNNVRTLLVDPFANAFTGENQNDNSEVGRFLSDLGMFARVEAGCDDLVVAAHAGKGGERGSGRGASALEDWPDAILRLWSDEDETDGSRTYWFSARGRDVDEPKRQLLFDPATRAQTLEEPGLGPLQVMPAPGEVDVRADILGRLGADPAGLSTHTLTTAVKASRADIEAVLAQLQNQQVVYLGSDGRWREVQP